MDNFERLSPVDASFLYAESPVSHMHVGSLTIFENVGLTEADLNAHIESRLHFVPRFRKKLAWVPAVIGRPAWVDDPHFDLRFHVRYTGLPRPGGEREALQLMGRVMSRPLDRRRPLWELWVFELPENRLALVHKTHHCLIDGISGVDLGTVMLDLSRNPPPSDPPPLWSPREAPGRERLFFDALVQRYTKPKELFRAVESVVKPSRAAVGRAAALTRGMVASRRTHLEPPSIMSLAEPIGPHRRFDIVRISLDDAKELKNRFNCTVNDVVLALVTGGLRKLLLKRGEYLDGIVLQAMVPFSVRDPFERMGYGNVVSMVTADLPVGEPNPRRRIEFVRSRMAGLKESKEAVGADFWVKLSEYASPTVLGLASRATALGNRPVHAIVTNVPGPQTPLFLLGGQMLEVFPSIPIAGTTALGIAVLSYNGQLGFGLTGDWDVVPDLDVLARGIEEALVELKSAAQPGRVQTRDATARA